MDTLPAQLILYYLPALIYLILFAFIILKLRTISTQITQAHETNKEMVQILGQIHQSLENRKP